MGGLAAVPDYKVYREDRSELIPELRRQAWIFQKTRANTGEQSADRDWTWRVLEGDVLVMVAYRIRWDLEMRGEVRIAMEGRLDTKKAFAALVDDVCSDLAIAWTKGEVVCRTPALYYVQPATAAMEESPNAEIRLMELRMGEKRPHVVVCYDCGVDVEWNPVFGANNRCPRCALHAGEQRPI